MERPRPDLPMWWGRGLSSQSVPSSLRRSADVCFPRGRSGEQEARDFSIRSAFRLGPALDDPTDTGWHLFFGGNRKNEFLGAASQCTQANITFSLVLEAVGGGWSNALRSVVGSRVRANDLVPSTALTPASRFRSASRAPSTEKTRAQSSKRPPEQVGTPCRSLGMSVLADFEHA